MLNSNLNETKSSVRTSCASPSHQTDFQWLLPTGVHITNWRCKSSHQNDFNGFFLFTFILPIDIANCHTKIIFNGFFFSYWRSYCLLALQTVTRKSSPMDFSYLHSYCLLALKIANCPSYFIWSIDIKWISSLGTSM